MPSALDPRTTNQMKTSPAVDPVCGMTVDPVSAAGSHEYKGKTYYFCSTHCLHKFSEDPERYLNKTAEPVRVQPVSIQRIPAPSAADPRPEKTEYTCPMHPEVVRSGPGSCPICGMALEPRTITLEEDDDSELRGMSRRFWVSAALTVPLVVVAMTMHRPWVELALATPVVLWGGWPFFQRAWASLVTRHLNMFTLIGLGVAVAYV